MDAPLTHTPECFASYMGLWMYEPKRLMAGAAALRSGTLAIHAASKRSDEDPGPGYAVERGIAIIPISGTMMKAESKYGGTSTVATRRAIRAAVNDPKVSGIMMAIDSPGGTVAGTHDLADDLRRAGMIKPTAAHTSDLMASAALYVGSQAGRLSAGAAAEVGSIGTVAVVEDSSEQAEMMGVKVHVVSTGQFKGAFADGAPVTAEHLQYLQERVNDSADMFIEAVAKGRSMGKAEVRKLADGRVFAARDAKASGLIDEVESFDQAFRSLERRVAEQQAEARKRTKNLSAQVDLASLG